MNKIRLSTCECFLNHAVLACINIILPSLWRETWPHFWPSHHHLFCKTLFPPYSTHLIKHTPVWENYRHLPFSILWDSFCYVIRVLHNRCFRKMFRDCVRMDGQMHWYYHIKSFSWLPGGRGKVMSFSSVGQLAFMIPMVQITFSGPMHAGLSFC